MPGRRGRYFPVDDIGRYKGNGVLDGANPHMKIVTIYIPEKYHQFIEKLIEWGEVPSRSEYIRHATEKAIKEDLKFMNEVDTVIESPNPDLIRIPIGDGTFKTHKIIRRLE